MAEAQNAVERQNTNERIPCASLSFKTNNIINVHFQVD